MLLVSLLAQAAAAAAAPAPAEQQQGVTAYPAAFFAQYQPGTAMDMINRLPGFSFDAGSSVRGYEGSAGNVLIDGERPASKTDGLDQILRRIQASSVDRIEVIRGGAPGIDMQGKTVIANVIRKKDAGFKALIAASDQQTYDNRNVGAVRVEASGALGATKWELATLLGKGLDGGFAPGPGQRIDAAGHVTPAPIVQAEGDVLQAQATGGLETPIAGGKLRLNGRLYSDKYKGEETDAVGGAAPSREHNVEVDHTDDTEIGGNYGRAFGARTNLEVVGLRQTHDVTIDSRFSDGDSGRFTLDRNASEVIGRAVLKYRWTDDLSLEGGAETAVNKQDSATRLQSNGAPVVLPAANVTVEEHRSEAFAKATWRPSSDWTVDAGVRFEHTRITSDGDVVLAKTLQYVKPRLAVSWDALAATQLRFRVEHEVGQLNFNDFVASGSLNNASGVSAGNPDLNPQQAWVYEATAEQRFWGAGSFTVTFRHSELKDVIDRGPVFTADSVFDQPTNIGDGTKDELLVTYNLPLDHLHLKGATLRGDLTKRWSSVTDPTTHQKREISGLHPLDWNLNFTQDIPARNLSFGVDVFGAWRESYYRFNLVEVDKLRTFVKPFVEWRPRPDWSLRSELVNATTRDLKHTYYSYPGPRSAGGSPSIDDRNYAPGRTIYVRLRKTFG